MNPTLVFFGYTVLPCFICTPMALDPLTGDYRQVHGSKAFPWFVMSRAPGWWWQRWWGGSPNPRRFCSFPKVAWLSSGGWTTAGWPPKRRSRCRIVQPPRERAEGSSGCSACTAGGCKQAATGCLCQVWERSCQVHLVWWKGFHDTFCII